MYGKPLDAISYECVQDVEGRSQKVGLTAAKLELDARPLNESIMRAALRTNQFFGLTAALLEVSCLCWHVFLSLRCTSRIPAGTSCGTSARSVGLESPRKPDMLHR